MRYRLRTMLFLLALASAVVAACWWITATETGRQLVPLAAIIVVAVIAAWISFAPERRFWREVAAREPLDDAEFYRQFYGESGVPHELVLRLLPVYCRMFHFEAGKMRPTDRTPLLIELDTSDYVRQIEQEFGLGIPDEDVEELDGSFDSIVRYLAQRRHEQPSQMQ